MFADYEHYLIDCAAAALIIGLREMELGRSLETFQLNHVEMDILDSKDGNVKLL